MISTKATQALKRLLRGEVAELKLALLLSNEEIRDQALGAMADNYGRRVKCSPFEASRTVALAALALEER